MGWARRARVAVMAAVAGLALAGCATLPNSSTPVTIGTLSRQPANQTMQPPPPGADPDQLLHDFLDFSNSPTDRHAVARQYLTKNAQAKWDDAASTTIVDNVAVLRESQNDQQATYLVRATRVAQLLDGGVYLADSGPFDATIELIRIGSEWRIDQLPPGVILSHDLFQSSYQPFQLFFLNPSDTALVSDTRWLPDNRDNLAQLLLNRLAATPRAALAPAVRNELGGGISVNQVVRADGRPGPIGVGLGGVRVDLHGAGALDQHDRELLAAQVIWTLDSNGIPGPYVLQADGKLLDDRYPDGWMTADVAQFDPNVIPGESVDLNAIVGGRLVNVASSGPTLVPGFFGNTAALRSATLSYDGRQVAAVAATEKPGLPLQLMIGNYGGGASVAVKGTRITRPTWFSDGGSAWAVVDGARVVRAVRDPGTGAVTVADVDASAITVLGRQITELRLAPDGVRAAVIVDGKIFVAVVEVQADGRYALTSPHPVPLKAGVQALSLDWSTGSQLLVSLDSPDTPLIRVRSDGSRLPVPPTQNLTPPVTTVDVTQKQDYVQDSRTILQLSNDPGETGDRFWREVPNIGLGAVPVLPG